MTLRLASYTAIAIVAGVMVGCGHPWKHAMTAQEDNAAKKACSAKGLVGRAKYGWDDNRGSNGMPYLAQVKCEHANEDLYWTVTSIIPSPTADEMNWRRVCFMMGETNTLYIQTKMPELDATNCGMPARQTVPTPNPKRK